MTFMAQEVASIPEIVAKQIEQALPIYLAEGERLRKQAPACLITCARGSSDHASLYFKYLVESRIGVPVCSMGPSIASVYQRPIATQNAAVIAVSQSGGSKDLAVFCRNAISSGLPTIALINEEKSPLAQAVDRQLPIMAGQEKAVAATKSFVCSMVALASIFAGWSEDEALIAAIRDLPEALASALETSWGARFLDLDASNGLFVVSRGPSFAIAQEAALKFKETCGIHAEAFSAAEVRHGPIALAKGHFSVLCLSARDEAGSSIDETITHLGKAEAEVLQTSIKPHGDGDLPISTAPHVLLDPICQITSFYKAIEQLTEKLGMDPDQPALLSKVTVTL